MINISIFPILHKLISIINNFIKIMSSINYKSSINDFDECEVLLFDHDVDRSISLNKRAYAPLLDSIKDELVSNGCKCISVSLPWSRLNGDKAYGMPISINKLVFINKLIANLLKLTRLNHFFKIENSYIEILKKTKAKLIISIGTPDELCIAARLCNVFHVELLHGIGYSEIPWGWSLKNPLLLPQGILALDKISYNTFIELENKGLEIKIIPHPFLKRFVLKEKYNIPKEWLPQKNEGGKFEKEILISLQWAYAGDHGPYVEYENILENGLFYNEIEKLVHDFENIFFRFRFHPVQLKDRKYQSLIFYMDEFVKKYPNSEWRESSTLPYPSIVSLCDGNISMSSMSCYDAAACGVNSLMLCPTINIGGIYADWFIDLVEEGYVTKSTASFDLIQDWVINTKKQIPRLSNLNDEASWDSALKWMFNRKIV